MKMNTIYLIILSLWSLQFNACMHADASNYTTGWTAEEIVVTDSTLYAAGDKIYGAFVGSFAQQNPKSIDAIINEINTVKPKAESLASYWLGYAYYYKSIYHLKFDQKEESEQAINEGIQILKDKKTKNAEDLALLALVQSFSIQFKSGITAGILSNTAKKNAQKAIELDPENLRAYYVAGSLDYYTPKQYGGGKKVESYLTQAIELSSQKQENPFLPAWGKEDAYVLLIKYFVDQDMKNLAIPHYREAIKLFPKSYQLGELAKQLI